MYVIHEIPRPKMGCDIDDIRKNTKLLTKRRLFLLIFKILYGSLYDLLLKMFLLENLVFPFVFTIDYDSLKCKTLDDSLLIRIETDV